MSSCRHATPKDGTSVGQGLLPFQFDAAPRPMDLTAHAGLTLVAEGLLALSNGGRNGGRRQLQQLLPLPLPSGCGLLPSLNGARSRAPSHGAVRRSRIPLKERDRRSRTKCGTESSGQRAQGHPAGETAGHGEPERTITLIKLTSPAFVVDPTPAEVHLVNNGSRITDYMLLGVQGSLPQAHPPWNSSPTTSTCQAGSRPQSRRRRTGLPAQVAGAPRS